MPDPSAELESAATADGLTEDRWLGGRLTLVQPKRGHRAGTDAALLVAAAGTLEGRVVDVGAGVGAVGLALAQRSSLASVDLVEIDPAAAALAKGNAERNGLETRARVLRLDALNSRERREAGLIQSASCIVTNPPFFDARAVRVSPDAGKARAHVLGHAEANATLADWIHASLAMLAPGGRFVMIHRPDALAVILSGIGSRLGALALLPVHPTLGASAHRLLVSGVKGSKAPLRLAPGLILHGPDGRLTAEADALHRGELLIDWGG
jgi:tRNA1(Val) A37 N6-methylase TrmN6